MAAIRTSVGGLSPRKITIPEPVIEHVRRPALVERAFPIRKRLTILKAPAGFGKTTLLAECCRDLVEAGVPTVWISLDAQDEPETLEDYIALACRIVGLDQYETTNSDDNCDTGKSETARLVDAVRKLDGPFLLALDDVDRLINAESVSLLEFLLRFGPTNLHLAMTCRELPPGLDLGGVFLEGHASVIEANDLRFSEAEIENFLDPGTSRQELNKILSETSGWPIAVRIYQTNKKNTNLENVAENNDFVANWIDSHVFRRFNENNRDFLFDIGLFEWIDADLATEVLGVDLIRCIDTVPALHGLLDPVPDETAGRWQLNPLIRAHCIRRQFRESPERFKEVNLRIAIALMHRGETVMAMHHAKEAGDTVLAGNILEYAGGIGMRVKQGINEFIAAGRLLNEEIVSDRPRLELCRCLVLTLTGDLEDARKSFAAAAASIQARIDDGGEDGVGLSVEEYIVRTEMARYGVGSINEEWLQTFGFNTSGFEGLQNLDPLISGDLQLQFGAGSQLVAQFDMAAASLLLARDNLTVNAYQRSLIDLEDGQIAMARGRVKDAGWHYTCARQTARKLSGFERLPAATAKILLEELALECDRLAPRPQLFQPLKALPTLTKSGAAIAAGIGIMIDLNVRHEGVVRALAAANDLRAFFRSAGLSALERHVSALRVSLLAKAAQVGEAEVGEVEREWVSCRLPAKTGDCLDLASQTWREMEALSCARLRLMTVRGSFDEGREFAEELCALAAARSLRRTHMRALALWMVLEHCAGENAAAVSRFREYLRLFEETAYAWAMVRDHEVNRPVVEAYVNSVSDSPMREMAQQILAAMRPIDKSEYPIMSQRELQILEYIETHQDKQIARVLGLSPFGVRYHVRKIFAKLGVHTKADAVRRARQFGLLIDRF